MTASLSPANSKTSESPRKVDYLLSACARLDHRLAVLLGWQGIDATTGPWITGWPPGVKPIASTRRVIPLWSSKPALIYELMCAYRAFPQYVPYDPLRNTPEMMEIRLPNAIGTIREVLAEHGGSIEAATGCAVARAAVFVLSQQDVPLPEHHVDLSGQYPPPFVHEDRRTQLDRRTEPRTIGTGIPSNSAQVRIVS